MQISRFRGWSLVAALAVAVLGIGPGIGAGTAQALQVKPIIFDMSSVGAGSRKAITVINSAATPVPMELKINRLDLGPNGEMIKSPGGEEDFLIFPPQTVIPPNSTQTFRIQWIGDPEIAESRSYNIAVNQLPVKVPEATDGKPQLSLQLVYSFLTTVTVSPPAGVSSFQVVKAEVARGKDGRHGAAVTVRNTGNMHNYLANAEVRLEGGGWSAKLTPQMVRALGGPGLVLPGHTRTIFLPIDDLAGKSGALTASVSFDD